ncbi:glucose-1-phosphate adenylyltransferase [Sedimenticola sp.]|uniref:glucose-1-phosphate adenylyltransferase n=1 Tax=Sedimenticola sp. TaxID=1940285 RepID=UPI00258FCBB2|nr:glucose-1-phosphate adenylyltransferase [Sedimenticola sp.]MCW8902428.1 glucose-1-phosphate adenylyltransferase [Sedimenticola sp.]
MKYKNSPRFISYLTRNALALILAGGRGVRLKQLTKWRAKPAVPFGGKFRIIDFSLSNCVNSGIRRIGVLTQYKSHSLNLHIQRGWGHFRGELREFVELLPAQQRIEASWYSGTADSVYQNLDIIRTHSPDHVLILAGDHIYKMDYGTMLARHVDYNADVTVGCIEVPLEKASAFGVMSVDEEMRINKFVEKPEIPEPIPGNNRYALCSMGIYIFNTKFLYEQLIRDADDPKSSHDFGKDVLPRIIGRYRVCAYPFTDSDNRVQAYWRDVGTVDAFWEANLELTAVTPELNLYDDEWPIWTLQEQLPPAKFIFDDEKRRGMAIDSMVSGGCIISGAMVRRSLLFSHVSVNDYSRVESSVVLPEVTIGKRCRISRAVIDKGCDIANGMVIGENPEEDREKYYVTPNGVVLVTPEMLGQSLHHVR